MIKAVVVDGVEFQAGCEKCSKGIIYLAQGEERLLNSKSETCECLKKIRYVKKCVERFRQANFPENVFDKYPFEKYESESFTRQDACEFAQDTSVAKNWLYLYGGVGRGKTYAAILVGLYAIAADKSVLYANVPFLMDELRPNPEDTGRVKKQVCQDVDLLILDDVGQEKMSDWVAEQLYILVQGRYHTDKKLILTSNHELETSHLQKQIVSRIIQKAFILFFDGHDRRFSQT